MPRKSWSWNTPGFEEWFWDNCVRVTDGCWLWLGWKNDRSRYGGLMVDKKRILAHRVAYILTHKEPIPAGLIVRHKCDQPPCIRPDHLELGTPADNSHDRDMRGRQRCPRGEAATHGVLTEGQVREIRALATYDKSLSHRGIAWLYKVDHTTIDRILSGRNWGHLL